MPSQKVKEHGYEKRYSIRLRLICDMRNSSFPYQNQSTRQMIQKLPLEVEILPEYLPYILDALFLSERMFRERLIDKEQSYEDLYREFENKPKIWK